jgi:hypothetical protein
MFLEVEKPKIPEAGSNSSAIEYGKPVESNLDQEFAESENKDESKNVREEVPFIHADILESAQEQHAISQGLDSHQPDAATRIKTINMILAADKHGLNWAEMQDLANTEESEQVH